MCSDLPKIIMNSAIYTDISYGLWVIGKTLLCLYHPMRIGLGLGGGNY